ncbi:MULTISPECIES: ATP-binding protein [Spirulina sp. CCY15215]|uniref:AAA family ATPase n=1 Tax=Spirulina sp. CCY15215 TaxID=2767591 RepID=UPI00194ECFFB|nr:ATP-binding protein [Spirulina major]
MLNELHLQNVGSAPQFDIMFAPRLNIFTGDNGLGKTFLLDIAWWSLTGKWSSQPASPHSRAYGMPLWGQLPPFPPDPIPSVITCQLSNDEKAEDYQSSFDFSSQQWENLNTSLNQKNIVLYCRVDGGFSLFDPARKQDDAYHFTSETLWNGLRGENKVLCNGLIQDWIQWQNQPDRSLFQMLSLVIEQLAPHAEEWMKPGQPTRVSVEDVRDIPTIDLPYGNIPIIYASAGMKRILGLAYLLVWTQYEHLQASQLRNQQPCDRIVLLIDEVESHLHPKWQRAILPAILKVCTQLRSQMQVQAIVTTHSPLILASVEPQFDRDLDKLFLFELVKQTVNLTEVLWSKQGDMVGWLTSEVFGLKQARSREAEEAIEAAKAWMRGDNMNKFSSQLQTQEDIHQQLLKLLPGHDPFFPRWIVKMEEN